MTVPNNTLVSIVFWLLIFQTASVCQERSYRFDRLTIEDGLPNPSVLDLVQDGDGYIWIGTGSGIVRYDGKEMKYYYPFVGPQDSLPELDLPHFFKDRSDNLWLAFWYQKGKLYRYDELTDRFLPYLYDATADSSRIQGFISCMFEDKKGRLLLATWDKGLYMIEKEKEKEGVDPSDLPVLHFTHDSSDPATITDNAISTSMAEDENGNIWMPTDQGLCKFIPGPDHFQSFLYDDRDLPLNKEYSSVLSENRHTLWVGTVKHGLLQFDTRKETFDHSYNVKTDHSSGPLSIYHVSDFQNGQLFLTVSDDYRNGKLVLFDPVNEKTTEILDEGTGNLFEATRHLIDRTGNYWIASWQNGVYRLNPDKANFRFYQNGFYDPVSVSSAGKQITSLYREKNGSFWVGTTGDGLIHWDGNSAYRVGKGLKGKIRSDNISDITETENGEILIGHENGIDYIDPTTGRITPIQGYSVPNSQFYKGKNGTIWILSWDGELCRLKDPSAGDLVCFTDSVLKTTGGRFTGFTSFAEDEKGTVWIGLNQHGMLEVELAAKSYQYHKIPVGVHSIHIDQIGNCWIATHSSGLKIFNRNTGQLIQPEALTLENTGIVRGIMEDDKGFLWMKTNKGIIQIDPGKRKICRFFSRLHWMDKADPWYTNGKGYRSDSGEMYIFSPSGVLEFHPDSLLLDSMPPEIVFKEFRISNKKILPGEGSPLNRPLSKTARIELSYLQNDLQFSFATLHFKSPQENRISFFLENYDQEWSKPDEKNAVSFTNLPPGKYALHIRAYNSDGNASPEKVIDIVIHSPWWKTGWAYLIYMLLAIGFLLAYRRYELRRQEEKAEALRFQELDAVKTKLYTNMTHEFRTPLTIILGLTGELKKQAAENMKASLETITRNSRQLLQLVNQMLDLARLESGQLSLKLVQGDIVGYIRYLTDSFHSIATLKRVSLTFSSGQDEIRMDYDPERLQQVMSNLLSNALKFTPENGKIEVWVEEDYQRAIIRVSDTGIGIPAQHLEKIFDRFYQAEDHITRQAEGTGIGLALTRELVKLMKGEIDLTSAPGAGSTFTIWLPITRQAVVEQGASGQDLHIQELPVMDGATGQSEVKNASSSLDKEKPVLLLVEDNADLISYVTSILQGNYNLIAAKNGQEGIKKAFQQVPDLVISDVMMPEMDGYELCKRLKSDERTSHIPVILLTAKADLDSRISGLKHGADAYIAKPFHAEELFVRIQKLLELRQRLQQHYKALAGLSARPLSTEEGIEKQEGEFLQKVKNEILANLEDSGFSVVELGKNLGMSRTQLHRKLKSLTGLSANQVIRDVRIQQAKEMLHRSELTVSEISYKTGFSAPDYFSKVFKKETGLTPVEFREKA